MPKFETVARETLGTTVYNQIRGAILDGEFLPGEAITIRNIANQMGVSATPVRDALLQLVMERVLEMPSAREIRVPIATRSQLNEIKTLRAMLEGFAAECAADTATSADIKDLEHINEKIKKACDERNPKTALELNRAFHSTLYSIAGMTELQDIVDRLWLRIAPMIAAWSPSADVEDFTAHHDLVLDALKARKGADARKAIVNDIELGGQKIDAFYTNKANYLTENA